VAIEIVIETHSTSTDNEAGIASGWSDCRLSETGQQKARSLGQRRRDDGIAVVLSSDLRRAAETARIAFEDTQIPILHDWRLRECDYGELNGQPRTAVHPNRTRYLDEPYPRGESWRQAVARNASVFADLGRWDGRRILLIGHRATVWACEHVLSGVPLEDLAAAEPPWQEGWEYQLLYGSVVHDQP
jgi:2,3-bisphosphoglycerate-dependent phosphoglycerate mutase